MSRDGIRIHSRAEDLPEDQKLQEEFALAAFATLKAKEIAYISVPISSGKRLYDYMADNGFETPEDARADHAAFLKHVVQPNITAGLKIGNTLAKKIDGTVITPGKFEKKLRSHNAVNWGQDAFMGLWIPLIDEKVTQMVMVDGWQYSNGSGEEYLQATLMQMGRGKRSDIKIVDEKGEVLTPDKGIGLLVDAFKDLQGRGLKPRNMAETIAKLLEAENRYNFEQSFHRSAEPDHKCSKHTTALTYDRTSIKAARKELRAVFTRDYPDILPVLEKTSSFDYSPLNVLFFVQKRQHRPLHKA